MSGPLISFPPHPGDYTIEDAAVLPGVIELVDGELSLGTDITVEQALEAYPDTPTMELLDGNLLVSPAPSRRHADVVHAVARWLEGRVGEGWKVRENVNVRTGERSLLIPDVTVYRADAPGPDAYVEAADVGLAVEVLSRGETPRRTESKVERYLEAGVAEVWTIDLADSSLRAFGDAGLADIEQIVEHLGEFRLVE